MAERFGLPVITLVDTVGAWPTFECERDGQSEVNFSLEAFYHYSTVSYFYLSPSSLISLSLFNSLLFALCVFLSLFLSHPLTFCLTLSHPLYLISYPSSLSPLSPPQQAIATNLTVMAGLKVPIITVMIGEGGTALHRMASPISESFTASLII
jgi:hypothetical protein